MTKRLITTYRASITRPIVNRADGKYITEMPVPRASFPEKCIWCQCQFENIGIEYIGRNEFFFCLNCGEFI